MKLTWSHTVLNVRDIEAMIEFYRDVLGFEVTDRGPLDPSSEDGPEIVFLSQEPDEHHQIAMTNTRRDDDRPNSLNHLSFRTPAFADLVELCGVLEADQHKILPLSHGNTLSLYFNDPEGNGLEVFWDTPWHVAQPQGKVWDTSLDEDAALAWVREHFEGESTFEPSGDYYERRRAAAGTGG